MPSGIIAAASSPSVDGAPFRSANGKTIGILSPDGYLVKVGLDHRTHHLHKLGGWATETRHLDELRAVGGRGIRLVLIDGRRFESTLADWERHGYRPKGLASDQTVLPDRFWTLSGPGGRQLALGLPEAS